ncbi:MAG: hypothetical protein Q4F57_02585 [Weeksellaceae bacterium]|nr:hypothetical protein [Weeksellaceae bacterium]
MKKWLHIILVAGIALLYSVATSFDSKDFQNFSEHAITAQHGQHISPGAGYLFAHQIAREIPIATSYTNLQPVFKISLTAHQLFHQNLANYLQAKFLERTALSHDMLIQKRITNLFYIFHTFW